MSDWTETHRATFERMKKHARDTTAFVSEEDLRQMSDAVEAIDAALAEIDRLRAMRAAVAQLPRYSVSGDRTGAMLEWPHGEFLAREVVLAVLE